jgi:hypothetical protein
MECKDRALSRINRTIDHFFMTTKHIEEIEKYFVELEKHFIGIEKYFVELEKYFVGIEKYFKGIEKHFVGIEKDFSNSTKCFVIPPRLSVRTLRWVTVYIKCCKSKTNVFGSTIKTLSDRLTRSAPWCVHRAGLIRYRKSVFCVEYCACDCPPCSC